VYVVEKPVSKTNLNKLTKQSAGVNMGNNDMNYNNFLTGIHQNSDNH
jgi:hypothetical protein